MLSSITSSRSAKAVYQAELNFEETNAFKIRAFTLFMHQMNYKCKEEVYFPIREINLSITAKKSVKWHSIWNHFFQTSNIDSLCSGPYLEVECRNQKTKLSIESHIIGDQNDIWVVGLRCFVWEEFGNND